jgi:acid phosphatase (class A)
MRLVTLALATLLIAAGPAAQAPVAPAASWTNDAADSWLWSVPPPPVAGSLEDRADLQTMLDVQAHRTPEESAEAKVDQQIGPERFAAVVGHPLDVSVPQTLALLTNLSLATKALSDASKKNWKRPRPYDASPQVQPVIDKPGTPANPSWSYPSGHSLWGYSMALVLSAMLPEKRPEILARGRQFGWNRVVGGVHWPTDVAAGRTAAVAVVARLGRDPAFRQDLGGATTELRAALKLPPRQPDLP